MPQLDKVTYMSQLFWLIVVFGSFYLFVWKSLLPSISQIFKVRQKKMDSNNSGFNIYKEEQASVTESYDLLLSRALSESRQLFVETSDFSTKWLKNSIKDINEKTLLSVNEDYITILGDLGGKKHLIKNCIHHS